MFSLRRAAVPIYVNKQSDLGHRGRLAFKPQIELNFVSIIADCDKTIILLFFSIFSIFSYRIVTIDRSVAADNVQLNANAANCIL